VQRHLRIRPAITRGGALKRGAPQGRVVRRTDSQRELLKLFSELGTSKVGDDIASLLRGTLSPPRTWKTPRG
jgi:hypothetical protein